MGPKPVDPLRDIRQHINSGERDAAREKLAELLHTDPQNVTAWALLAPLLDDPQMRADCYRRILQMNPDHSLAEARLRALTGDALEQAASGQQSTHDPARPLDQNRVQEKEIGDISDEALQELALLGLDSASELRSLLSTPKSQRGSMLAGSLLAQLAQAGLAGIGSVDGTGTGNAPSSGSLEPDEIISLAGGAVPTEEQTKCPGCKAVVTPAAAKCPWCSADIPRTGISRPNK